MSKEIKNILVTGAGVMGSSIAQVFAANGYKTTMTDIKPESLESAEKRIHANIEGLKKEGLADESYAEAVAKNLSAIRMDELPGQAETFDLVAEAVYEDPKVKHDIYEKLVTLCRQDCIFASDTSAMDIFSVTKDIMVKPERLVIAHWFNPPHLMKLIEIVRGPETSDETTLATRNLLEKCGKKPVVLNKYMPGFIVNRMSTVICRELLYMADQGWASPQDLETALMYTDGLRWSFEGPLELVDFVGLKIPMAVAGVVLPTLCNDTDCIPYGDRLVAEGKTGVRAGEGILGTYPSDVEGYIAKRNRRIIRMYKLMNEFEKEDEEEAQ